MPELAQKGWENFCYMIIFLSFRYRTKNLILKDYKCTFTQKQWIVYFNNDICLYFAACAVGYYKPAGGNSNCYLCPEHSYSNVPHSIECTCDEGFYRSSTDAKTTACTRMYDLNVCSSIFVNSYFFRVRVMVFNTTFKNISVILWQSVLMVEDIFQNLMHCKKTFTIFYWKVKESDKALFVTISTPAPW